VDLAQVFLAPGNPAHRQYEALRAYFVDQVPGPEVAEQFGYTLGSFHQLVHQFRQDPQQTFFSVDPKDGWTAGRTVIEAKWCRTDWSTRQNVASTARIATPSGSIRRDVEEHAARITVRRWPLVALP